MAFMFSYPDANYTFLSHFVLKGNGSYTAGSGDQLGQWTLLIYGGTQPSADDVVAEWSTGASYYNSYLALFDDIQFQNPASAVPPVITTLNAATTTFTTTAVGTGTASWALCFVGTHSTITSSIPSVYSSVRVSTDPEFFICPVSDTTGSDVVRLTSTAITSGNTVTLNDISFQANGGAL